MALPTRHSSSDFSSPCWAPRASCLQNARNFSQVTLALGLHARSCTSSPKLVVNSLRALFSAFRTGRMDNLVLQAVEEVALEGPEGDAHQPPHDL